MRQKNHTMEVMYFAEHDEMGSIALLYHDVWHETHGPYMPKAEREVRDFSFFSNESQV